jgi:hypothetical protein
MDIASMRPWKTAEHSIASPRVHRAHSAGQQKGDAGTLTTEEAGEKAAVFKGFKFGFEPDALFADAGLLFD